MNNSLDKNIQQFKNPALARELIEVIRNLAQKIARPVRLMEVCGTHTVSIARFGIRDLMPDNIQLASGPGCPVCVTSNHDIDTVIALSRLPQVVITTFGDMTRVPGSTSSLIAEQAEGHDIRIVYSPLDALDIASTNPDREIVFVGVGFETTTPLIAQTILRAHAQHIKNFSVYVAHKNMPNALKVIVDDPETTIDAFILPGHVSTIIGAKPYQFLADDYKMPCVITGFEPVDILQGIAMILEQIATGSHTIEIAYARAVMSFGNPHAQHAIDEVFDVVDAEWRGLGTIPQSGYALAQKYQAFDACERLHPCVETTVEHKGCKCGEVLRGIITPDACPLFHKVCTQVNPIGPCMVSSEGACAAYYRYYR